MNGSIKFSVVTKTDKKKKFFNNIRSQQIHIHDCINFCLIQRLFFFQAF